MQFKYPELLYALFLLVIPIIVHLFQLRKFKKTAFTNVALLKRIELQTRKSSQIKKWMVLAVRMLLFAAVIFAFAQPYFSKKDTFNTLVENVIYLDNSFSMQAKGNNGILLKRAVQDIITSIPNNETFSLLTNTKIFKDVNVGDIKNELLELPFSSNPTDPATTLLKAKQLFSNSSKSIKNIIYISDFQIEKENLNIPEDSTVRYYAVKLQPIKPQNISVDTAYISANSINKLQLSIGLKRYGGDAIDNLPVSLYNNNNLIAKTATPINDQVTVVFELPVNEIVNGEVRIIDAQLQFDNNLYFNINKSEKINVLSITGGNDNFLERIYTKDEFNFKSVSVEDLNYNEIDKNNLIVLNEMPQIPQSLITVLKTFTRNGGSILLIPSINSVISSYNALLTPYNLSLKERLNYQKRITTINYDHALYKTGVFENRVTNFQYPKVNSFFPMAYKSAPILTFEDNNVFLTESNNIYLFTASLSNENSNFKSSPLIVPTLYNIARNSYKIPNIYYTIGITNSYEILAQIEQDEVLHLGNNYESIIPRQKQFGNKSVITTQETPVTSGTYSIKHKNNILKNVSYNYSRTESNLIYQDMKSLGNVAVSNSVIDAFQTLKSDNEINALWKWFVIFALILLITEMLILKYFK